VSPSDPSRKDLISPHRRGRFHAVKGLLTASAENNEVAARKRCLVLGGAVAAALVALSAGGAAARNPWIVFGASPKHGTQVPQLFRVRASGVGLSQITTGLHPASDPAFAADGRRVAFARLSSGLFVVNVDGSGLRRLTANGSDRYPVWSPNSRVIAFVRAGRSSYRLWLMTANGRRQRRLRSAPSPAGRAAWTPDGKSLVIASGGAFYEVSAATGKVQKRLAPTYDVSLGQLSWTLSPTGRMIAYVGRRAEPAGCERTACEVFALYLQGVRSHRPQRSLDDAAVAGWSPDGHSFVYAHGGALNVQALSGGTLTTIPVGDLALDGEAPPAWQPR
jgi:Tol biopolymer transport system component